MIEMSNNDFICREDFVAICFACLECVIRVKCDDNLAVQEMKDCSLF